MCFACFRVCDANLVDFMCFGKCEFLMCKSVFLWKFSGIYELVMVSCVRFLDTILDDF